MAKLIL